MTLTTVAICAYNARTHLEGLLPALAAQAFDRPFEILVVDNNSTDATGAFAREMSHRIPIPIRVVEEPVQGIPYARNRAIEESAASEYLVFIDADERPLPGWLKAAVDALEREGAECAGGPIQVRLPGHRPAWLSDYLLLFLGALDHGAEAFWITDRATPVWSGNVAYRRSLFASGLRFDHRYNRAGKGVGGGSDSVMFRQLLARQVRIRYRPDMLIEHLVGKDKVRRRYFLHLNLAAGTKFGRFGQEKFERTLLGVPPFMVTEAFRHFISALGKALARDPDALHHGTRAARMIGAVNGCFQRWRRRE